MDKQKILLIGSSGFAGNHVMQEISRRDFELTTLSRKIPQDLPANVINQLFDFESLHLETEMPHSDHLVICLGTPLKLWELIYIKNKNRSKFIKTDKELVINLARAAKKSGIKNISIVSAVGANSDSLNTYLKTKGQVEEEIINMDFESTNIYRPAHMCGRIEWEKAKDSYRFDVLVGEYISILPKPFMVGPLTPYKGVDIDVLARSIVNNLNKNSTGVQYFTYEDFLG